MTAEQIKTLLNLKPLAFEGGYFAETYRAPEAIPPHGLPRRYRDAKSFGTAIYFLLTAETFSAIHRLPTDEIYHFYLGDPVELIQLHPDGSGVVTLLGQDILHSMRPQLSVPRGVWQGSRLRAGGSLALMGTTMAPGFDFSDYEAGQREDLVRNYPAFQDMIHALTR